MERKRVTRSPEQRRHDVLAAARALFLQHGYEQTTMSDIAQLANVAQGTTYIYFRSKQDILVDIVRELLEEIANIIKKWAGRTDIPAIDAMRHAMDDSYERISHESRLVEAVLLNANHSLPAGLIDEYVPQLLPSFASMIERGVQEGSMRVTHPHIAADFLWTVGYRFLEAAALEQMAANADATDATDATANGGRDIAHIKEAFTEFALQALGTYLQT